MSSLRRRLLGQTNKEGVEIRPSHSAAATKLDHPNDLTATITSEEEKHESMAGELLRLTGQMKQNFMLAGSVLKDDNTTLSSMQSTADSNRTNLVREQKRLHHHAYRSCSFDCIMLLTIVFIIWTFIAMILVMKVFPKRTS